MIYVNVSLFLEGPSGLPDGDPDRARPLQVTYAIPHVLEVNAKKEGAEFYNKVMAI